MQTTVNIPAEWMRDTNTLQQWANELAAAAIKRNPDNPDDPTDYEIINQDAFQALQIVHEVMIPASKQLRRWKPAEFFPPQGDIEGRCWGWSVGDDFPRLVPASTIRRVPGVFWMPTAILMPVPPAMPEPGNA